MRLAPTLVAPGLVALCLAGCVTPQVYVTSLGPLMVRPEPDLVIFNPVVLPDGFEIEPTPILGGLVVRTLGGQPVPFEARDAALEAIELTELAVSDATSERGRALAQMVGEGGQNAMIRSLAGFAAERLFQDTRIAAFSLGGWDTHRRQDSTLPKALGQLADAILTLQTGLGPVWGKTVVIAMTEFGRTVRENGSKGTDHGTGGAMIFAGGALRGGRVLGRWPGLDEADLYARRDLLPTGDVRSYAAWALRDAFGIDRAVLEGMVFPGLTLGDNPGLLR